MNILVVGGNGFIGSNLVKELTKTSNNITVADKVFHNVLHVNNIEMANVDFLNVDSLSPVINGKDLIYLCAGTTSPISSWEKPMREINENISPIISFLDAVSSTNVKKIVFISSGGTIYGKKYGLLTEQSLPCPFTPYAIGKLTIEYLLNYLKEKTGINNDIYRIANVYGIDKNIKSGQGVIPIWINSILRKEKIYVYGCDSVRDYVYVEDVAKLMSYSIRTLSTSELFNIGTGRGVTSLELLNIFRKVIDFDFDFEIIPSRPFDNTSSILDSSKITANFPEFKFSILEDKIKEMWERSIYP